MRWWRWCRGAFPASRQGFGAGPAAGGLRQTVAYAVELHLPRVWLHEAHIWYAVELDAPRARPPLPSGFRLLRATRADLPLLERLADANVPQAHDRMDDGADLWFVVEANTGEPVFRVWSFYRTAPVTAARGGVLALPPDVRAFARQRSHRVGPFEHVAITPYGEGLAGWLAGSMTRSQWSTGR